MTDHPWVVLLTGGALPGQPPRTPLDFELELDLARGLAAAAWREAGAPNGALPGILTAKAFKLGWKLSADNHMVRAVYLVSGTEEDAARFSAWLTAEVDPAYVRRCSDPLAEMLNGYQDRDGG